MDTWNLETGKIGLDLKGKYLQEIAIKSVSTPEKRVFSNVRRALALSLEKNGFHESETAQAKYLLEVVISRHELVHSDDKLDKYEAEISYELHDSMTMEKKYLKTFVSSFSSDDVFYEADIANQEYIDRDRTRRIMQAIIHNLFVGGFYSAPSNKPKSHDDISGAGLIAAERVIRESFRAFLIDIGHVEPGKG